MLTASQRTDLIDQIFDHSDEMSKPEVHRTWLEGLNDAALVDRHSSITGLVPASRLAYVPKVVVQLEVRR